MKSQKDTEKMIRQAGVDVKPETDFKVLAEVLAARRSVPARGTLALKMLKFAAAAVLMICGGYLAGRLSAHDPVDVDELKAAVRADVSQEILKEMDGQIASESIDAEALRDEICRQIREDFMVFASDALAASEARTNQRFVKLIELIEATRIEDRNKIAAALERIEAKRLEDRARLGSGLVSLAARTDKLLTQ